MNARVSQFELPISKDKLSCGDEFFLSDIAVELATNDIKIAVRPPARGLPTNNQLLRMFATGRIAR